MPRKRPGAQKGRRAWRNIRLFKANADRFQGFGYFTSTNATTGEEDSPVRSIGMQVSADFFSVLQLQPLLGRFFRPEEQTSGKDRVVVLSQRSVGEALQCRPEDRRAGDSPGRSGLHHCRCRAACFEEIFTDMEFFKPYTVRPEESNPMARYAGNVRLIGRLKPGVTLEAARAQLEVLEKGFYETIAAPQLRSFLDTGGYRIAVDDRREGNWLSRSRLRFCCCNLERPWCC